MHRRQGLIPAIAATIVLAGCGQAAVEVTPAPGSGDPLCRNAAGAWPETVGGENRREVSTRNDGHVETEAAWGDPAIIARCGVPSPGPNPNCLDANGIDWVLTRSLSDGKEFVTFGRTPAIQVLIPNDHLPEVLGAFAEAAAKIPQGKGRCS